MKFAKLPLYQQLSLRLLLMAVAFAWLFVGYIVFHLPERDNCSGADETHVVIDGDDYCKTPGGTRRMSGEFVLNFFMYLLIIPVFFIPGIYLIVLTLLY